MVIIRTLLKSSFLLILCLGLIGCGHHKPEKIAEEAILIDTVPHIYEYGICIDSMFVNKFAIQPGDNPASIFSSLGFSAAMGDSISRAAANVLDPKKLRVGMHYATLTSMDSLQTIYYIAFAKSLTDFAIIDLTSDSIRAFSYQKDIFLKRKYIEGTIKSSLWNEIQRSGVSPLLALKISDVYAWQIDFFDIKEGDSYQIIYREAFIDDSTSLGIESVEAGFFSHLGKNYSAIPFQQDSLPEFFDIEGNSLRKAFLKAPLDFFRITSRFTNARLHPILKRYRAHHGVDYAAPTGTPVKSIGTGTVIFRGWTNGGGNTIKIRHNSIYTTTYMHLSRFAAGLTVGKSVQQGEIIGYVGSTGLSTGPHLDFRVYKNGTPINPLEMEAPPSKPIEPLLRDSFSVIVQKYVAELDSLHLLFKDSVLTLQ